MANNPSNGALAEFSSRPLFHLALPALDLKTTRLFYTDVLGAKVERADGDHIDFNFFGGLLTVHRVDTLPSPTRAVSNEDVTPLPNFGLVMGWEDWHRAVDHMNYIGVAYRVPPSIKCETDRQFASFAINDPSGNCLSFCAYAALES